MVDRNPLSVCRIGCGLILLIGCTFAVAQEQPELLLPAPGNQPSRTVDSSNLKAANWSSINQPFVPSPPADPKQKVEPKKANEPKAKEEPKEASSNQFAGATEAGTQPGEMFNPTMFGDLIGVFSCRIVTVPGQFTTIPITGTSTTNNNATSTTVFSIPVSGSSGGSGGVPIPPSVQQVVVTTNTITGATTTSVGSISQPVTTKICGIPVVSGGYAGFKVSDNDTPRPVDRFYMSYNYFGDVNRSQMPSFAQGLNLQQQLFGFEKTFLDGDASFGMRLPYIQLNGMSELQNNVVGDLSLRWKFAWINDPQTGNVFSTGMIMSLPTGNAQSILPDGTSSPSAVLFQPWAGFIYNFPRWYTQGFSSLAIPSDSRDPMIFFNSISAGYWLYRDNSPRSRLKAIVPVIELHLNTPLTNRSMDSAIFFQDQFNLTTGIYTMLRRMTIGVAVGTPLVGPKPYNVEAIGNLNFRF